MIAVRWMPRLMVLAVAALLGTACEPATDDGFDLVIKNGRVMDPETQLDAVRTVVIDDGTIVMVTDADVSGGVEIDAAGLVVAPGFIDVHSHSPSKLGATFQVLDGVTTQLDLEAGAFPVAAYGHEYTDGAPLHFGSSVSHLAVRTKVIEGRDQPYLFDEKGPLVPGAAFVKPATPEQIEEMRALLNEGLDQGGLGIGVLLDYMSIAVSADELRMIFEVAGARKAPIAIHVRRGFPGEPKGLDEVIALAEETGAPVLINHITHNAMQAVGDWLAKIDAANARGANITTETLTYAAGGTSISAAVFSRDWQKIFNISYEDVQWTATGEWLTQETWEKYRTEDPSGMVNHHYVKEDWMETALRWPRMMASSDVTPALSEEVMANPNLSGTFTRLLGHYVRDRKVMSLQEGLAKTSLYQAQWMEQAAPLFRKKGRLQEGADADIVIFDPETVAANATYGKPYVAPTGISHVIVGGVVVAQDGALVDGALPGQRLLNKAEAPQGSEF